MNKRLFLIVVLCGFIVASGFVLYQIFGQRTDFTFTVQQPSSANATVLLFKTEDGHYHTNEHDPNEAVANLSNSQNETLKLKKGSYEVSVSGEGIEQEDIDLYVGNATNTLTISPTLSKERLTSIRQSEAGNIRQALLRDIPNLAKLQRRFTISEGALYEQGEWYGTKIFKKSSSEDDREAFRVVAHKEEGEWKVKTIPPQLLLSVHKYPDIPRDVLVAVNKQ